MKKVTLGMLALTAYAYAATALAQVDCEQNPELCDFGPSVPEPGTFGLLAAGIAAVVAVRLLKRK